MKKFFRFVLIFVLLLSFTGCRTLHQAEEYIDHKLDVAEDQAEQALRDAISPTSSPEVTQPPAETAAPEGITEAQAQAIALEHAGLAEQDVSYLQVRGDWDDGRQEYEVEFQVGYLEYEYEIDAASGKILSFDKDA